MSKLNIWGLLAEASGWERGMAKTAYFTMTLKGLRGQRPQQVKLWEFLCVLLASNSNLSARCSRSRQVCTCGQGSGEISATISAPSLACGILPCYQAPVRAWRNW